MIASCPDEYCFRCVGTLFFIRHSLTHTHTHEPFFASTLSYGYTIVLFTRRSVVVLLFKQCRCTVCMARESFYYVVCLRVCGIKLDVKTKVWSGFSHIKSTSCVLFVCVCEGALMLLNQQDLIIFVCLNHSFVYCLLYEETRQKSSLVYTCSLMLWIIYISK